jgi:hypothetical protein
MMGSKLSTTQLGKIWDLSDIDRDGFLNRYEFTVAMHLTYRALQGDKMPAQLPLELSEEKVPKPLSALPNLASAAPKVFFILTYFEIVCKYQHFDLFLLFKAKLII